MCYVHVTALVAEYLTRKGKDVLEPHEDGRPFRRIRRQGIALHALSAFYPWLQHLVASMGKVTAAVLRRGWRVVLASHCSA